MNDIILHAEEETAALAARLAGSLENGDILMLYGDLGAGKTVFARALIRHLTGQPDLDVPSPTFTLAQQYDSDIGPIWHFDLYRLKDAEEIYEIGWEEALSDGVVLIEWPERFGALAPEDYLGIRLSIPEDKAQARRVRFEPTGAWIDRKIL